MGVVVQLGVGERVSQAPVVSEEVVDRFVETYLYRRWRLTLVPDVEARVVQVVPWQKYGKARMYLNIDLALCPSGGTVALVGGERVGAYFDLVTRSWGTKSEGLLARCVRRELARISRQTAAEGGTAVDVPASCHSCLPAPATCAAESRA